MSDSNIKADNEEFFIDFYAELTEKRRRTLFYKRPQGVPVPVGQKWRCVCKTVNVVTTTGDSYCTFCGSRLRHQENAQAAHKYHTGVLVFHLTPRN